VVQGSWNTVIVNSNQTNNGDVTAGTALNGNLDLP
jgi:holdfast attachment protein HfaA